MSYCTDCGNKKVRRGDRYICPYGLDPDCMVAEEIFLDRPNPFTEDYPYRGYAPNILNITPYVGLRVEVFNDEMTKCYGMGTVTKTVDASFVDEEENIAWKSTLAEEITLDSGRKVSGTKLFWMPRLIG